MIQILWKYVDSSTMIVSEVLDRIRLNFVIRFNKYKGVTSWKLIRLESWLFNRLINIFFSTNRNWFQWIYVFNSVGKANLSSIRLILSRSIRHSNESVNFSSSIVLFSKLTSATSPLNSIGTLTDEIFNENQIDLHKKKPWVLILNTIEKSRFQVLMKFF